MVEKLHQYCHMLLKRHPTANAHLLDFYGGVGLFGINNAGLFQSVAIVENVKRAIDFAQNNIQINKTTNVETVLLDAKKIKTQVFPKPLFVIADPPRSGIHPKALKYLK